MRNNSEAILTTSAARKIMAYNFGDLDRPRLEQIARQKIDTQATRYI